MAFQRKKPAAIGVKANFPGFIEPALASSIGKVPSGSRWLHEIKFDGYRVQLHIANEDIRVFTRRGNDWTNRFKKIVGRRLPDQRRVGHHRRRDRRALCQRHHRLLGSAERADEKGPAG